VARQPADLKNPTNFREGEPTRPHFFCFEAEDRRPSA
jgi:hypothetical protein